jgi:hypothetical protein
MLTGPGALEKLFPPRCLDKQIKIAYEGKCMKTKKSSQAVWMAQRRSATLTQERRKEIASIAGKASGESRMRAKVWKEHCERIASLPVPSKNKSKITVDKLAQV